MTIKKWIGKPTPKGNKYGTGWVRELNRAYSDGELAVMVRTIQTEWGEVEHVCIRNRDNTDIPWAEKQRVKNELFGPGRIAVEVFPDEKDLVDNANMYHIWILSKDMKLPFTLK